MKITIHDDGALEFDCDVKLRLCGYTVDLNNPRIFRPKSGPCKFRVNKCRVSDCGKRQILRWHCNAFNTLVSMKTCESCNVREKP